MSDAAARFAARYGERLSDLLASRGPDDVLGFRPADLADEPASLLPEPGTAERTHFDQDQAMIIAGLLNAARMRPKRWDDPAALPSRSCFCSACGGQSWWTERDAPNGWRCAACLPPINMSSGAVRLIDTANRPG